MPIEPMPIPAMGPDATGMGPRQWLTHGRKAVFRPLGTVTMPKGLPGTNRNNHPGISSST